MFFYDYICRDQNVSAVYLYAFQGPYQKDTVQFEEHKVVFFCSKNQIFYFILIFRRCLIQKYFLILFYHRLYFMLVIV
jgi:hypothetical protein